MKISPINSKKYSHRELPKRILTSKSQDGFPIPLPPRIFSMFSLRIKSSSIVPDFIFSIFLPYQYILHYIFIVIFIIYAIKSLKLSFFLILHRCNSFLITLVPKRFELGYAYLLNFQCPAAALKYHPFELMIACEEDFEEHNGSGINSNSE